MDCLAGLVAQGDEYPCENARWGVTITIRPKRQKLRKGVDALFTGEDGFTTVEINRSGSKRQTGQFEDGAESG